MKAKNKALIAQSYRSVLWYVRIDKQAVTQLLAFIWIIY